MNKDIFLLFFNAFLSVVLAVIIVYRILKKEYNPKISELEKKQKTK